LLETIKGYSGQYPAVFCSLENNYLAVGYESPSLNTGKTIHIINGYTGGLYIKLIAHSGDVPALAKLENQTLASGSTDFTIKLWNWKRGQLIKNLTGHTGTIFGLVSLLNGNLASCSEDNI
jgi:WD40 repeat protein